MGHFRSQCLQISTTGGVFPRFSHPVVLETGHWEQGASRNPEKTQKKLGELLQKVYICIKGAVAPEKVCLEFWSVWISGLLRRII